MSNLKIGITADTSGFSQQMNSAVKASEKFAGTMERMESGSVSSKQALRQLTQSADALGVAYASMSDEMRQSDFGKQIMAQMHQAEQAAAAMKDSIGDLQSRITSMSSDTAGLDATIQGFQGMAGAASAVTGTMALFGVENESVAKSLMKVQGALAVLNGIQAVAKVLNKDSAMMIQLKTLATKKDTAATLTQTAATEGATVAQNGLNLACLANPYVLLAMAVVGVATALYTFSSSADEATKEQEELNDAMESSSSEYGNQRQKLESLCNEWKNLRSEQEKNQFIKDNEQAFKDLGVSVKNVDDAEWVFEKGTQNVIKAMELRAKAMAYGVLAAEEYAKAVKALETGEGVDVSWIDGLSLKFQSLYKSKDYMRDTQQGLRVAAYDAYSRKGDEYTKKQQGLEQEASEFLGSHSYKKEDDGKKHKSSSNKSSSPKNNNTDKLVEGSIKYFEAEIKKQEDVIANTTETEVAKTAMQQIELLKKQLANKYVEFGKEVPKDLKPYLQSVSNIEISPAKITPFVLDENAKQKVFDGMQAITDEIEKKQQEYQQKLDDAANRFSDGGFSRMKEQIEAIQTLLNDTNIGSQIEGIGGAMQVLGQSMQQLGHDSAAAKIGMMLAAIGQLVLSFAQAMASASSNWITWLAFGLTGMATLTSMISQIKGFESGGIVKGSTTMGDGVVTRLNAGEMVLNSRQQNHLFNAIDKGKLTNGSNITVTGKICGSDIYLSQKNYSRTKSLVGKNIGIK